MYRPWSKDAKSFALNYSSFLKGYLEVNLPAFRLKNVLDLIYATWKLRYIYQLCISEGVTNNRMSFHNHPWKEGLNYGPKFNITLFKIAWSHYLSKSNDYKEKKRT